MPRYDVTYRWRPVGAVALVLCGGCGILGDTDSGRTLPSASLIAVCIPDFAENHAEIEVILIAIDDLRLSGRSREFALDALWLGCNHPRATFDPGACTACSLLAVRQVYGP